MRNTIKAGLVALSAMFGGAAAHAEQIDLGALDGVQILEGGFLAEGYDAKPVEFYKMDLDGIGSYPDKACTVKDGYSTALAVSNNTAFVKFEGIDEVQSINVIEEVIRSTQTDKWNAQGLSQEVQDLTVKQMVAEFIDNPNAKAEFERMYVTGILQQPELEWMMTTNNSGNPVGLIVKKDGELFAMAPQKAGDVFADSNWGACARLMNPYKPN